MVVTYTRVVIQRMLHQQPFLSTQPPVTRSMMDKRLPIHHQQKTPSSSSVTEGQLQGGLKPFQCRDLVFYEAEKRHIRSQGDLMYM